MTSNQKNDFNKHSTILHSQVYSKICKNLAHPSTIKVNRDNNENWHYVFKLLFLSDFIFKNFLLVLSTWKASVPVKQASLRSLLGSLEELTKKSNIVVGWWLRRPPYSLLEFTCLVIIDLLSLLFKMFFCIVSNVPGPFWFELCL